MSLQAIKILVSVPLASALARGSSSYGQQVFKLDDADVASLSEGARNALVGAWHVVTQEGVALTASLSGVPLIEVNAATRENVLAALELLGRVEQEKKQAAWEERNACLAKILTVDLDAWVKKASYGLLVSNDAPPELRRFPDTDFYMSNLEKDLEKDPAFVARREQARCEVFEPALVAYSLEHAARVVAEKKLEAEEKTKQEAQEKAKIACERALRNMAKSRDQLARAAMEDYPIANQMLTTLANELVFAVVTKSKSKMFAEIDTEEWCTTRYEDRAAPRSDAFALLDCVVRVAREINTGLDSAWSRGLREEASVAEDWVWDVSRILRLDTCTRHGRLTHYVTAVLVTLRTPCGTRQVTFSAESLECNHERRDRSVETDGDEEECS